jgi:hypothetical protein
MYVNIVGQPGKYYLITETKEKINGIMFDSGNAISWIQNEFDNPNFLPGFITLKGY